MVLFEMINWTPEVTSKQCFCSFVTLKHLELSWSTISSSEVEIQNFLLQNVTYCDVMLQTSQKRKSELCLFLLYSSLDLV